MTLMRPTPYIPDQRLPLADEPGDVVPKLEGWAWFELREPGCVPRLKGPLPPTHVARFLRELFQHYPTAHVTVITVNDGVPLVQDGPECLQMLDGRSMSTGRKHIARTNEAHAEGATVSQSPEAKP